MVYLCLRNEGSYLWVALGRPARVLRPAPAPRLIAPRPAASCSYSNCLAACAPAAPLLHLCTLRLWAQQPTLHTSNTRHVLALLSRNIRHCNPSLVNAPPTEWRVHTFIVIGVLAYLLECFKETRNFYCAVSLG